MFPNTDTDTKVTFFRTTLDELDLYSLDDLINHGHTDGVLSPATTLAEYLRDVNPKFRWYNKHESIVDMARRSVLPGHDEYAKDDSKLASTLLFDALVVDNGKDEPAVIANLWCNAARGSARSTPGEQMQVQPAEINPSCVVFGTTFEVMDRSSAGLTESDYESMHKRFDEGVAHWVAGWDEPVDYMFLNVKELYNPDFYSPAVYPRNVDAPVLDGFQQIEWGTEIWNTWNTAKRARPGLSVYHDLGVSGDPANSSALVSSFMQGRGFAPLLEVEVV